MKFGPDARNHIAPSSSTSVLSESLDDPQSCDAEPNESGLTNAVMKQHALGDEDDQTSLTKPLKDPPAAVLTAFFFDQFICPDTGWYAYLPRLYQNTPANSYLFGSIQAASLFVLANRRPNHSELMARASRDYGDTLRKLNAALGDQNERLKDQMLCAVLILILIEVSSQAVE